MPRMKGGCSKDPTVVGGPVTRACCPKGRCTRHRNFVPYETKFRCDLQEFEAAKANTLKSLGRRKQRNKQGWLRNSLTATVARPAETLSRTRQSFGLRVTVRARHSGRACYCNNAACK